MLAPVAATSFKTAPAAKGLR